MSKYYQKFKKWPYKKLVLWSIFYLSIIGNIIFIFNYFSDYKYYYPRTIETQKEGVTETDNVIKPISKTTEEMVNKLFSKYDDVQLINDNRPDKFSASVVSAFIKTINEDQSVKNFTTGQYIFIRDYVLISKKIGYLVLYVRTPSLESFPRDYFDTSTSTDLIDYRDLTCPSSQYGQQLNGEYYLGLIRDNKMISAVELPKSEYTPNRPTFRDFDELISGQFIINEQPVLNLEDLNGDGLNYEVKFKVGYESCGNNDYAIGGYDLKSDSVIFYPIINGGVRDAVWKNINPNPDGSIYYTSGCDHGADFEFWGLYKFDPNKLGYVLQKKSDKKDCEKPRADEFRTWMEN